MKCCQPFLVIWEREHGGAPQKGEICVPCLAALSPLNACISCLIDTAFVTSFVEILSALYSPVGSEKVTTATHNTSVIIGSELQPTLLELRVTLH
jgi:hypothetical protein